MLNDPLMLASLGLVLLSLALFYWPGATDEAAQPPAEPEKDDGLFPLSLLSAPKASGEHQAAAEAGRILETINDLFIQQNINAAAVSVQTGPTAWTVEIDHPFTTSRKSLTSEKILNDIGAALSKSRIRALATREGVKTLGIEITRATPAAVCLRALLQSPEYRGAQGDLLVPLGVRADNGLPLVEDLAAGPHAVITGTTGSGKSIALNALICALLYRYGADALQLVMIDPKCTELAPYGDLPQMLQPVVTDMSEAAPTLAALCDEMDTRYKFLESKRKRDISELSAKTRPPRIVCIIEEYADLHGSQHGETVSALVQRLAQKARAAGIHLVLVTQRPTVRCLPSEIKTNINLRITGRLPTNVDSRTVLDQSGAEKLAGKGDMLAYINGEIVRYKSPYISTGEITNVVAHLALPAGRKTTATEWFRMWQADNGDIEGRIIKGPYEGRALNDLQSHQIAILAILTQNCHDSQQLLGAWIAQTGGEMPTTDPDRYRALMGLASHYTKSELKKAWMSLRGKTHPDRGGSAEEFQLSDQAYQVLAKEINV